MHVVYSNGAEILIGLLGRFDGYMYGILATEALSLSDELSFGSCRKFRGHFRVQARAMKQGRVVRGGMSMSGALLKPRKVLRES